MNTVCLALKIRPSHHLTGRSYLVGIICWAEREKPVIAPVHAIRRLSWFCWDLEDGSYFQPLCFDLKGFVGCCGMCFFCLFGFVCFLVVLVLFVFWGAENGCDDWVSKHDRSWLSWYNWINLPEFNFFCGKSSNFKTFARTTYSLFVCQATALSTTIWKLLLFLFDGWKQYDCLQAKNVLFRQGTCDPEVRNNFDFDAFQHSVFWEERASQPSKFKWETEVPPSVVKVGENPEMTQDISGWSLVKCVVKCSPRWILGMLEA